MGIILPIDELIFFWRWLLHHQPILFGKKNMEHIHEDSNENQQSR